VRFETESSLHTGIFGISTALVRDDEGPLEGIPQPPPAEAAPMPPPAPAAAPWTPPLPDVPAVAPLPPTPPVPASPPPPAFPAPVEESPPSESVPHEPPVRSPLDPDPSEPPGGFPAFPALPLDPEPVEAVVPPFVPPLPDVPPLPPTPSPDVPSLGDPAPGMPSPYAARPDETMIAPPEAREELVLIHDDRRTVIDGPVLQIGRAPGCDIVLDDRNVSRRHAEIRRRGPVVVLVDLDSTNGTIVNGRRVREHPLADGDRITLGNSRLTFERRTT
jgi:hypothetical protein